MGRMAEVVVQVYRDASRRTGLTFVFIDKVFQIVGEFNVVTFVGRQKSSRVVVVGCTEPNLRDASRIGFGGGGRELVPLVTGLSVNYNNPHFHLPLFTFYFHLSITHTYIDVLAPPYNPRPSLQARAAH